MRFKGTALKINEYTVVTLPRKSGPIELRVNALPIGLKFDFEIMCPRPRPPFTMSVSKDAGQKKVEQYDDPAYLEAIREHRDLERYYLLYVALKDNPDLEFDVQPHNTETLRSFRKELKDAGFSEGDSKAILDAAITASNIRDEDVDTARKGF